jgi:hypothetical protein
MKLGLGVTVLAAAFALTACGGSGAKLTTKEQAAQAVFGANTAMEQVNAPSLMRTLESAATISVSKDYPCTGGSMTAHVDMESDDTGEATSIKMAVDFNGCVTGKYTDPKTKKTEDVTVDGTIEYALDLSQTSVSVGFNGHLDFSGGIDDSVDLNNLVISAATTGAGSTISITGEIKTSTQTFTYDTTDTFTFNGEITAAP